MTFWTSETLARRVPYEELIEPYSKEQIEHCAYELRLGPEAFITSTEEKKKTPLKEGEPIVIPPGQFALLLTEEVVKIPLDAIGFISMRFGVKRRGLINVSGFHVDPGFEGRLKFSVYNAGSKDITLTRGERVFAVWYSALDRPTKDGYGGCRPGQNTITSDDQNIMHGEVASPGQLKSEIDDVRHFYLNARWVLALGVGVLIGILVRLVFMSYFATPTPQDMEGLKEELRSELRQELREEISERLGRELREHALIQPGNAVMKPSTRQSAESIEESQNLPPRRDAGRGAQSAPQPQ